MIFATLGFQEFLPNTACVSMEKSKSSQNSFLSNFREHSSEQAPLCFIWIQNKLPENKYGKGRWLVKLISAELLFFHFRLSSHCKHQRFAIQRVWKTTSVTDSSAGRPMGLPHHLTPPRSTNSFLRQQECRQTPNASVVRN